MDKTTAVHILKYETKVTYISNSPEGGGLGCKSTLAMKSILQTGQFMVIIIPRHNQCNVNV